MTEIYLGNPPASVIDKIEQQATEIYYDVDVPGDYWHIRRLIRGEFTWPQDLYGSIARTINFGVDVTSIAAIEEREDGYDPLAGVQTLRIPGNVKSIGDNAFGVKGKKGEHVLLTSLTLGDGVESVGAYAFNSHDCSELNIPSTVQYVDECAFAFQTSQHAPMCRVYLNREEFEDWSPRAFGDNGVNPFVTSDPGIEVIFYLPSQLAKDRFIDRFWSKFATEEDPPPDASRIVAPD